MLPLLKTPKFLLSKLSRLPATAVEVVAQVEPLSMGWCLRCHRNPEPHLRPVEFVYELLPHHCLAWSYLELGEREMALPILEYVEREIHQLIDGSTLPQSGWVYLLAMNAVLMGDDDLAIQRLGQAVDAGWRGYYVHINDPRWSSLAGDPRFQRLMNEVKADVDRQAEEVDRIDAEENFPAILDAVPADRGVSGQ